MTEIRFYHLQRQTLEQALPALTSVAYGRGHKIVILAKDDARINVLNEKLWTESPHEFLPHGSDKEGNIENQPIFLTTKDENPNQADVLILTDGLTSDKMKDYALCCDMFDGLDEKAVDAARTRWKTYKDAGYQLVYYAQDDQGRWVEAMRTEKKAEIAQEDTAEKNTG